MKKKKKKWTDLGSRNRSKQIRNFSTVEEQYIASAVSKVLIQKYAVDTMSAAAMLSNTLPDRLAPVLKTIFYQCVI